MDHKTDKKTVTSADLGFVLSETARLMRRNFNRQVQQLNLTQAQWQILVLLARNEGMRQIQLAEALELQPISIARLIDRMQAAGWVERRPDPDDRRAVQLYLTEQANPILDQMRQHSAFMHAQALEGLSPAEQTRLVQLLIHVRDNLSKFGEC